MRDFGGRCRLRRAFALAEAERSRIYRRSFLRERRRCRRHLVLDRYPGIACDVESYSYLPLLDETGYIPSMKFASGFEILEHCQRMAQKFGFYDHCLFHTTVEATTWDEASGRWIVETDRGDKMRA